MTRDKAITELIRIWHSPHLDLMLKARLGEVIETLKENNRSESLVTDSSDVCKESESKLDLISRQDAIDAVEKLKIVEDNKNYPDYAYNAGIETAKKTLELMLSADAEEYIKECNTKTHDLVHRDVIKPKLVDCTDFVLWLLDEIMDEENWELNAVAYGEIIARKLKKLGLLEVKDGYYIRTSAEARPTGEWIFNTSTSNGKSWNVCSECGDSIFHPANFCPNCGADMRGGK